MVCAECAPLADAIAKETADHHPSVATGLPCKCFLCVALRAYWRTHGGELMTPDRPEAALSAARAALAEMDTLGEVGPETVRALLLLYARAPDEELTGDGRALKAALLTVLREAGFVLEAEVARMQEALQIASDMFRGEGWTEAEEGRIAQVRAALKEAK